MTPETTVHVRKLAAKRWIDVDDALCAHGIHISVVNACGFHYRSAFEHGYKHALQDMAAKTRSDVPKLAWDHWGYVEIVLEKHGVPPNIISVCGFHYRTAFDHGYQHALEDIAAEDRPLGRVDQ